MRLECAFRLLLSSRLWPHVYHTPGPDRIQCGPGERRVCWQSPEKKMKQLALFLFLFAYRAVAFGAESDLPC